MSEAVPSVVLVHGAFADGSSWGKVLSILLTEDVKAQAVQLPLTSFEADVEATRAVIARQPGPVVLVGHSYGGVVISEAGNDDKVAALVYVAAIAPDVGEDVGALMAKYPSAGASAIAPDSRGYLWFDPARFHEDFCGEADAEEAAVLAAVQKPVHASCFGATLQSAAWKTLPSWYLVADEDRLVSPDLQRWMAERMDAEAASVETGHAAMIVAPEETADLILDVVAVVSEAAEDADEKDEDAA
jgi:pimeloyl-ACP methyl ester carboxylesterase